MPWPLPKSLNGLLLLGLGILAGPLLLAIVHAALQMRHLSDSSQQLVADSVQTTRQSQDMFTHIGSIERSARLYQVLGESQLVAFREADNKLGATVALLRGRLRAPEARNQLQLLLDEQTRIRAIVDRGRSLPK